MGGSTKGIVPGSGLGVSMGASGPGLQSGNTNITDTKNGNNSNKRTSSSNNTSSRRMIIVTRIEITIVTIVIIVEE